jgi:hypothetical protein
MEESSAFVGLPSYLNAEAAAGAGTSLELTC